MSETPPASIPIAPFREGVPDDCPGIESCSSAMPIHEQLAELRSTVGSLATAQERLEAQMELSWKGHELVAQQVAEMKIYVDAQISRQTSALSDVSGKLADNTASTERAEKLAEQSVAMLQGLHDILAAGRVASKFGQWLVDIRKPLSTIALVAALFYGIAKGWAIDVWKGAISTWQAFSDTRLP